MDTDTYLGMPTIKSNLYFINKEFNTAFSGNFNIDLGNASLLLLFKQSLAVQKFLKNNPSLETQKGFDKQGNVIAEVFELDSMFIGNIKFTNPTIAITHLLPKFTTDGCIELKFFKQSEIIFDFDNNMFYISRN
jgi:hypothetical protein